MIIIMSYFHVKINLHRLASGDPVPAGIVYVIYREFPAGKGFADMVFLPKHKFPDKPALVIELKWDKSAEGAIKQIKEKNYCQCLSAYQGQILLVGVNYDKKTKKHQCEIEEYTL